METVKLIDLQTIEYGEAWDRQKEYFKAVESSTSRENYLLYCQHPHVYTLGKSGEQNNLLINDDFLKEIGATFFKIDRGGDITYHGFGQLVGYPIINISYFDIGLRDYIHHLEEAIIQTVKHWGIDSHRIESAAGVWVSDGVSERKIAAIGVKASRYVTMHGFALNVNTDLSYFNHINPCGFSTRGVTSIKEQLGVEDIDFDEVKGIFIKEFAKQLNCKIG